MRRTWTILGVRDVPASLSWYQSLFGLPPTPPDHEYFGQILDADGTVLLCLHQWGAHEHPSLRSPETASPGNGLLLFFRVDDYDNALTRARALVPRLEEEPNLNPNTRTWEFSLRDPDGYYVTVSALAAHRDAPNDREGGDVKHETDPPVACSLTADQLAEMRRTLLPGLFDRAAEVGELSNGIRLRFDSAPRLLQDLAAVMEQERACCRFLRFELKAEPGGGPVTLDVTGPDGTAEMLRELRGTEAS